MSDMYPPPEPSNQNPERFQSDAGSPQFQPQQPPMTNAYPTQPQYPQQPPFSAAPGVTQPYGQQQPAGYMGYPGGGAPTPPAYVKTNLAEYWKNARNGKRNLSVLGGVIVVFMLLSCVTSAANAGHSDSNAVVDSGQQGSGRTTVAAQSTTAPAATPAPTHTPAPTATPAPTYAHFDDGTFQVGTDIQPGTYRTRTASSGCYYARLKGFSGSVDDIIANNNTDGPAVITISPTDKGFQSERCGTWTKDLSQITDSKTTFDEGIYIVGTDLEPGTYKNSGSQGCYYARLNGFGGTIDDINANNNTDAVAIVTISASDKGFESARCGTWIKQ